MINIDTTLNIATLCGIAITWAMIKYFPSNYIKEKAKNLATKEDISTITTEIESIKTEHQKQLEIFKSQIWKEQQSLIWSKENRNNQIKILTEAISTMGRYASHAQDTNFLATNTDACLEISTQRNISEESKAYYRKEYEDFRTKTNVHLTELDSLKYKLDELHILTSVYFNPSIAEDILEIKKLGSILFANVMTPDQTKEIIKNNYSDAESIKIIRQTIAQTHAEECQKYDFKSKIKNFYNKAHKIISESTPIPSD